MSLFPAYMSDAWKCYEQMAREDRESADPELVSVDPQDCHAAVLPFLAWEAGANITGLSESVARKVIAASFLAMQHAGTVAAVEGPVEALSESLRLTEWFEYGGDPYNFRVDVDASDMGLSLEMIGRIENTVQKYKNARSVFETIKISMLTRASMKHALAVHCGEEATVYPYFPEPLELGAPQYMGAACHAVDTTYIYPQGA